MSRGIFILVFIYYIFGKVQANSLDYCSDSDDINDNVFLWQNLFKKINDIISEASELKSNLVNISEDIKQINKRQTEQELKLTAFMEKTETQLKDFKNRDKVIENFMENINDQKVTVNEFMAKVEHYFKDINKGLDDQKIAVNEYMTKIEHHFEEINKGQKEHKESTTHLVKSDKLQMEDIGDGQTEQRQSLNNITDIYSDNIWTTILRRQDGSVDFNRNWTEYKMGFGDPNGEFFIGLEKLHKLTTEGTAKELMIILEDFENEKRTAKYNHFRIGNENEKYILKELGDYSGDAGDSLSYHKGKKFSTYDQDNSGHAYNCAEYFKGGWWYSTCYQGNLCGVYKNKENKKSRGISWLSWKDNYYSFKYAEMKIR